MEIKDILPHFGNILAKTDFQGLGERKQGKVRDSYFTNDRIVMVATDRHSSFDRIIAHVPCKGQVLTQTSRFWFEATQDIVPNHALSYPDPNVVVGKRCRVLPIEAVVRGYNTGVTDTALWTRYQKGERDFGFFTLPDGMRKNQPLPEPVLTPTTKSEAHDANLRPEDAVALVGEEVWREVARVALALFKRGQQVAAERGLILVDTKYEFGFDEYGNLTLVDEIHTPDSSRYWYASSYAERFAAGQEPEYFDKEFLRLWFKEHCDPYHDEVLPQAPRELVAELTRRYVSIYERITGSTFEVHPEPIGERIERNLVPFHV